MFLIPVILFPKSLPQTFLELSFSHKNTFTLKYFRKKNECTGCGIKEQKRQIKSLKI